MSALAARQAAARLRNLLRAGVNLPSSQHAWHGAAFPLAIGLNCKSYSSFKLRDLASVQVGSAVNADTASTQQTPSKGMGARARFRKSQSRKRKASSSTAVDQEVVLLVGFPIEEVEMIRSNAQELFPSSIYDDDDDDDILGPAVIGVGRSAAKQHLDVLQSMARNSIRASDENDTEEEPQSHAGQQDLTSVETEGGLAEGRVVLLCGQTVQEAGGQLNDQLCELGIAPAVVAAPVQRHYDMALQEVVQQLRQAHARYHELMQPLVVDDSVGPPHEARVVLNAIIDAGEVPSSNEPGEYRRDEGHAVVLDGLCSEAEREEILDWLTAEGHDHSGPPPEGRWEKACVDRVGDQATWGLRQEVLRALQESPPPALVALQSRLAALYPEFEIGYMPASQLSEGVTRRRSNSEGGQEDEEEGEEEVEEALSSFVGNAVMAGDPCAWHVDADPTSFPASSPWVHNFGYYHNREPGRPLFVSMLLYLNDSWPDEYHSETLLLDPESQTGMFVRPAAGRILLMDQDVPHRISSPSQEAGGRPRYSLVWKLVFFPRTKPADTCQGEPTKATADQSDSLPSICRPEWGTPLRFGSSYPGAGQLAWTGSKPS